MSKTTTLLAHLTVQEDLSLQREPLKTGRVRHLTGTFRQNYNKVMMLNLLFLLFVLPIIILWIFVLPNLENAATADLNFSGNIGIGYPGAYDDPNIGKLLIYDLRIQMLVYIIPCFALMGVGAAGVFYCVRNMLWGVPVKLRVHFFRGIKKYWWQYLSIFTLLGSLAFMIGYSIINHQRLSVTGAAGAGSWAFMICSILLGVLLMLYLMFMLPMMVCYKMKFGSVLKNSGIFFVSLLPVALINLIGMGVPMLLALSSFTRILLLMVFLVFGFAFYCMWIMSVGQYAFDNFIHEIYEYKKQQEQKKQYEQKKVGSTKKAPQKKPAEQNYVKSYKKKKK